jgi:thioredoxin 1
MASDLLELEDSQFEERVIQSSLPIIVDFCAPWCGPCKQIQPILDDLAQQFAGRVSFARMDIAEQPLTAARYGIRSIPALMLVKDGVVKEILIGAQPKGKILKKLEQLL